jgi:ABC-type sugar transport systems, ATPase components
MGRAIVRDPAAFLMDEPLSNLDAKLRVQTRTEVSRLQRRLGTTMVYVTHDQVEALTLGDRVAVMRTGVLQQVASPKELYERPVNLFVAGFIGSPADELHGRHARGGHAAHQPRGVPAQRPAAAGSGVLRDRARSHRGPAAGELRGRGAGLARQPPARDHVPRHIDVLESLGSDVFVYFTREVGPE